MKMKRSKSWLPSFVIWSLSLQLVLMGASAWAGEKFGGVEIGAKGVKVSAVETEAGPPATLKVLELDKKTVDITISKLKGKNFADVRIDDVADVVAEFVKELRDKLGVPEANIQIVASSGVPFANNYADLVKAIRTRTEKELEKIDATEEATLTATALVPKRLRTEALIIDVGSGNTKGGAFLDDSGSPDQFAAIDVPLGTTSLTRAVDTKVTDPNASRLDAVKEASAKVGDSIKEQMAAHPELAKRKLVLFSGGSVWAFVTIMKPGTALDPFPKVTAADIKAYMERIAATPGKYPEVDFAAVANADARKAAEADYSRIRGGQGGTAVFKPEELLSGAAILQQVSDAADFSNRTILFDRKAVTAWITAKVTPQGSRSLLPEAFSRNIPYTPGDKEVVKDDTKKPEPPKPAEAAAPRQIDEKIAMKAYGAGYTLYWAGQYAEAMEAFDKAIHHSKGDARFSYFKGLTQLAMGDKAAAHDSFVEGAKLEQRNMPDDRTVGRALEFVQGPVRRYLDKLIDEVQDAETLHKSH